MKKILILICSVFILAMGLISCGSNDSVRDESWYGRMGYVSYKDGPTDVGRIIDQFYAKTANIEGIQDLKDAKQHTHTYIKEPTYNFIIEQFEKTTLDYEEVEKLTRQKITSTPKEVKDGFGIWIYCDEEKIYVINTKYDNYRDLYDGEKPSQYPMTYRYKVEVNGLPPLKMEMKIKS